MRNRVIATLGFGGALLAAAILAACGGGGGAGVAGSSSALPTTGNGGSGSTPSAKSGTKITVKIDRAVPAHKGSAAKRRAYISFYAEGLQVAVSSTGAGATTQTVYADLSPTSPLCSMSGSEETCTLTVATLAASETIVATEIDQEPMNDSGGYGTGFPMGSKILAATSTPVTTAPGTVTNLPLGLDPVAVYFAVCGHGTSGSSRNFAEDTAPAPAPPATAPPARIVVTSGVPSTGGVIGVEFSDADSGYYDADPVALPFVDVNGSPTPITITSSSSDVTLAPIPNPSPASLTYSTSGSIPNDGYEWADCVFLIGVNVDANLATPAPITFSNNLSALSMFSGSSYANTFTMEVVPVSASALMGTPSVTGGITATVIGSDYEASNGMGAESVFTADDGECIDTATAGQEDASVTPAGPIDTFLWTQNFTINPLIAGTCTFYLYDVDTKVITAPITVMVGS
ncbi:MAG: hypothetical protein WBD74_01780 [Candidatus Aquilonibacter sp.]